MISESELILNEDGSVYHLHLLPKDIATTIILVGDPDRVSLVSAHFDSMECRKQHREFITHTGTFRKKRITVISTGIGTDNIDIVLTELDALANVNLETRTPNSETKELQFIRVGTCGILQEDIELGAWLYSSAAVGFDSLMSFYKTKTTLSEEVNAENLRYYLDNRDIHAPFYWSGLKRENYWNHEKIVHGITATLPGFYGPQGRELRLKPAFPGLINALKSYNSGELRFVNFEMETAGIFALSSELGHQCASISLGIAQRSQQQFIANDEFIPKMNELIEFVLDNI